MGQKRHSLIATAVCALAGLILSAAPLAADNSEKRLIVVLPFQAIEASAAAAQSATALLETALADSKLFAVVSQAERDRALRGREATLAECADEECAIRIGKLLQATQVVMGNVVGLGKKLILNAKIIEIDTAQILAADTTSAASDEGLEQACLQLAQSLMEGVQPGAAAVAEEKGQPAAEAAAQAPTAAEEREQAGPVTGAEQEKSAGGAGPSEKKPAKVAAIARNRLAFWLTMSGLLAMEVGNITSSIGFEMLLQSDESYQRYLEASAELDSLYGAYQKDYGAYLGLEITSFTGWGLGASAVVTSLFLRPRETYPLSRLGKIAFTTGLSLTLLGNMLGLLAGNQKLINTELYDRYLSATTDADRLFSEYKSGYALYSVSRILSYSFWGLGTAAWVGSFFLAGERTPVISGPLDRWLTAAGMVLIGGGSLAQSLALHLRRMSPTLDQLYADNRAAYNGYVACSVLAYGFWALGGAGILTALFVTPSGLDKVGEKPEKPATAFILPVQNGLTLLVFLHPKELRP
jgi:TolB-like protein